jgi:hypothetical protein
MNRKKVIQKRCKLVASLPAPDEVLRGSLLQRTIFHRQGCARCQAGTGHKVWVLTVSYPGGRNRQFSIRPEQREMVHRWLGNYQQWKRRMEEICELNHEFLRVEE